MMHAAEERRSEVEAIAGILAMTEPQAVTEFDESSRMNLIRHMEIVGMTRIPAVVGDPMGERACGDSVCEKCGQKYPPDWRVIGYGNVPFLTILCDGRRVKL